MQKKQLFLSSGRQGIILLTVFVALVFTHCESNDRFYRPNLPEKLCSIGIIDADDTTRYISFEKSFQAEYAEELNDSLREFSFTISSLNMDLINYQSDNTIKNLIEYKIPESIEFRTGEKYYLLATEKTTPDITAEVIVPEPPSVPTLITIHKEIAPLSEAQVFTRLVSERTAVINISFMKSSEQKLYYALLLEGTGFSLSSIFIPFSGLLDFSVRGSNSPGFLAVMHGLKMFHYISLENELSIVKSSVHAYFIDGSKIPDNFCNITLSTQFGDSYCVYDAFKTFRIKLLSIPEELYRFEKSLNTYGKISEDPFAEPVYLNGNIKDGNGIFAICRSSELIINLSPMY